MSSKDLTKRPGVSVPLATFSHEYLLAKCGSEKRAARLLKDLKTADHTGDGNLHIDDIVAEFMKEEHQEDISARRGKVAIGLFVALVLSLAGNFALTFAAIETSKEVKAAPDAAGADTPTELVTTSGHPAGVQWVQKTFSGLVVDESAQPVSNSDGRLSTQISTMPCAEILSAVRHMEAGVTSALLEWETSPGSKTLLRCQGNRYSLSASTAALHGVTVNGDGTIEYDVTCALTNGACASATCPVVQSGGSRRMLELIYDVGEEEMDALLAIETDEELKAALEAKKDKARGGFSHGRQLLSLGSNQRS